MDIDIIEIPETNLKEFFSVMTRDAVAQVKEQDQEILSVIKPLEVMPASTSARGRQSEGWSRRYTRRCESLLQPSFCRSSRLYMASRSTSRSPIATADYGISTTL